MAKQNLKAGVQAALPHYANGECYNPLCDEKLIVLRLGQPVKNYEMAHIRDELPPEIKGGDIGWRYDPPGDLTQEQRNQFDNIILLCSPCHKLIDKTDPRSYSVELLHQWKVAGEGGNSMSSTGTADDAELATLIIEAYRQIGLGDRHAKHDVMLFRKSEEILAETALQSFFAELWHHDSCQIDLLDKVMEFFYFFTETGNSFIDAAIEDKSICFHNALNELTDFIGVQFFAYPLGNDSSYRYLQPLLNGDRGGTGEYDDTKRYREKRAELHKLVQSAGDCFHNFRMAVKHALAV